MAWTSYVGIGICVFGLLMIVSAVLATIFCFLGWLMERKDAKEQKRKHNEFHYFPV